MVCEHDRVFHKRQAFLDQLMMMTDDGVLMIMVMIAMC